MNPLTHSSLCPQVLAFEVLPRSDSRSNPSTRCAVRGLHAVLNCSAASDAPVRGGMEEGRDVPEPGGGRPEAAASGRLFAHQYGGPLQTQ